MSFACNVALDYDSTGGTHKKGSSGGTDDSDATDSDPAHNNPDAPTNQGPQVNVQGYAAIAPIMAAKCNECHHAGTWMDLTSGADAATADKIIAQITGGAMPPAPRAKLTDAEISKIRAWKSGQAQAADTSVAPVSQLAVTQILDGATLTTYKAALPQVRYERLQRILNAPSTLFWDKRVMPPAYQDVIGDGSSLPFGARLNNSGKSLIVQPGQKLFSTDGSSWAFPFGHTAGADDSTNAFIVNFLNLPEQGGKLGPIAYKVDGSRQRARAVPRRTRPWARSSSRVTGRRSSVADTTSALAAITPRSPP